MNLEICGFSKTDYTQIINLWKSTDLPAKFLGRDSEKNLSESSQKENCQIYVAKIDGKVVGTIIATDDSRKGWINRLAVDPYYRNFGIASKLIAIAESYLKKKGIKVIAVLIDGNNRKSLNLFGKSGYSEYKNIKYYTKRESNLN